MADEYKPMKFGCGRYIQAPGAMTVVGREAKMLHGTKALIIGGKKALDATGAIIEKSLKDAEIQPRFYTLETDCCYETLEKLRDEVVPNEGIDIVIGTGGGKSIDMTKATGKGRDLPVINAPSSVATFNCWSAMSVMYTLDHKPLNRIWHETENNAVILDTQILANAPVKLFASGMADAFAKYIETGLLEESYTILNTPVGMYCSKVMAGTTNEIIFNKGEKAYRDCRKHEVTPEFEDCVFANVATTGIAAAVNYNNHALIRTRTGKGATFAHALYYACKAVYTEETKQWLHGEIVGLGCQAEMYAFQRSEFETKNFARFMQAIGQPMSIRDLGIDPTDANMHKLVDSMMTVWGQHPEEHRKIMYDCLQMIKG
ncbi:MAG: iron-containing alcohol dehydrogenase [Oscillospiraceae bacterium]|nr:iron-containing alcohol dehydrogenase [Oscillospiraceae bacterium]